ncbi:MAG: methionyl-tRNA formyltransferase [Thermoleophilia bacterium]
MRVAFAGSPEAAVPPLRELARSAEHDVVLAVTQPDKARGRSRRPSSTPLGAAAEELGIPVIRPATINAHEVVQRIDESGADALVVVAFGQILRDVVLSRWECVNVHFSLLPAYRGAAPVERAIMDGVPRTGVAIMRMEAGLDTGPVFARQEVEIAPDEDAGSLTARLSAAGGPLLVRVLSDIEAGRADPVPQPDEGVSLAAKITSEDRLLDLSRPAAELARRVRALSPQVGATLPIDGQWFKVWRTRVAPGRPIPGLVTDGGRLLAGTGADILEILELQPPGKGRMATADFLRGYRGELRVAEPADG